MLTYLLLKRKREERESDFSDEESIKSSKSCPDEEKQESNGRLPTPSNRQASDNPVVQPMSDSILNEEEDSALQDEELGLRARRCKVPDSLTDEQEDALAEWFQSQPLFFDQSVRDFKNKDKRERLLEEKAQDFGLQGKDIMLWFKSQRTIYGRLKKKKSGLAPQSLTARQRWVMRTFSFLSPYLIARNSRNLAKHNHAPEMRVDDDSWDEDVAQLDISQYDLHPGPLRLPESIASEEELVNMSGTPVRADLRAAFIKQETPDDSTEQTTETLPRNHHLQPPTSEVLDPRRSSSNSPRTAWANWLTAEVMELPEELWRKFQRESFELVMRYKEQQQVHRQQQSNHPGSTSGATFHFATIAQPQHQFR